MCRSCGKVTHLQCKKCKTVHYCSAHCAEKDFETHKKVCFPILGDRLKAIANLIISEIATERNLSGFMVLENSGRRMSAFSYHGANHCAFCEEHLGHFSHGDGAKPQYIVYRGISFYGLSCRECHSSGKKFCQETFMVRGPCWEKHLSKIYFIVANREKIWPELVHDLHRYLIHLLSIVFKCR